MVDTLDLPPLLKTDLQNVRHCVPSRPVIAGQGEKGFLSSICDQCLKWPGEEKDGIRAQNVLEKSVFFQQRVRGHRD